MILDVRGVPIPPPEIVRRLQQVNPRLGLTWSEGWGGRTWALTMAWAENDPRRARIQAGTLSPDEAYDLLAFLPADCNVDQAYGYLVNAFRASSEEGTRKLLDRVHEYNRNTLAGHQEAALADALNYVEVRGHKFGVHHEGTPKVYAPTTPAKRGKTARELGH